MPKISTSFAITVIFIVAIFLGGIVWFSGHEKEKNAPDQPRVPLQQKKVSQNEQTVTESVYRDEKLGIEVRYENSVESIQKNDAPDNGDGNGIIVNGVSINRYENIGLVPSGFGGKRESVYDLMKDPNLTAQKKIDFQGDSAFSAVFTDAIVNVKEKEIFVEHEEKIYVITYPLASDGENMDIRDYEKIVNNIRLINK